MTGVPRVIKTTLDYLTREHFANLKGLFRSALVDLRATMSADMKAAFCVFNITHNSLIIQGLCLASVVMFCGVVMTQMSFMHLHIRHRLNTLPKFDTVC